MRSERRLILYCEISVTNLVTLIRTNSSALTPMLRTSVTVKTRRSVTMWRGKIINHIMNWPGFYTYFWSFSKQQFPHRTLPHPGPNSSRSSLVLQARSSWSTYFRLFPAVALTVCGASKITFVFGEFIDNAERRGDSLAGDGDGVVDHVKCGVGGWEAAEAVHVREHIAHIIDRHLF